MVTLLSWSKLLGFPVEMEFASRIDSLMKIRENIVNLVGGEMPSGSANGDKVYILICMGGGNNSIITAYEYEWVKK